MKVSIIKNEIESYVESESEEKAWEIVEEAIATNMSQDWLMDEKQLKKLKEVLNKNGNRINETKEKTRNNGRR